MADTLIERLRERAEQIINGPRQPVAVRGRFPEPTISDTLEGQAADALEEAERVIAPLAVLQVPTKVQYNAGAYSLRFDDIRAAQAWRDKYGSRT